MRDPSVEDCYSTTSAHDFTMICLSFGADSRAVGWTWIPATKSVGWQDMQFTVLFLDRGPPGGQVKTESWEILGRQWPRIELHLVVLANWKDESHT